MSDSPGAVFECGNPKCAYAIDSSGLKPIPLKALRMWAKTCPRCGQLTHWQEKLTLLDTQITKQANGGLENANTITNIPRSQSQKRRAARADGYH